MGIRIMYEMKKKRTRVKKEKKKKEKKKRERDYSLRGDTKVLV